jgi:O-antigen/teichoic acid export membrane protein
MALKLGRTAAFHFLTQVVVSLSGFVATFAIARFLGPEPLGFYAKATAILFLVVVPILAIHTAIMKRISEGDSKGEFFGAGLLMIGGIVLVLGILTVLGRSYFSAYIGAPVTAEFVFLLVSTGLFKLVHGVLSGEKQVGRSGLLQSVDRILRTLLQVGFIFLGYSISGLLIGHAVALMTAGLLGAFFAHSWPRMPSKDHLRSVLEYARFSWLARLKGRAFGWTDTAMLGLFVASSLIGIYEVAWALASTLILVSNSIQHTLFPEFSDLSTDDDYDRIHHLLNEGLVFTGVFCIPGLVGAALVGPRILAIYGGAFRAGSVVLVLLILARLIAAFGEQFISAINAIDRPRVVFYISATFIIVNVVLNGTLIWAYGWQGAAVATTLSSTGLFLAGFGAITRLIGRPTLPWKSFGSQVLAASGMGGAIFILRDLVPTGHYWTVALVVAAAIVYTVLLVGLSGRVREKVRGLVRSTTSAPA